MNNQTQFEETQRSYWADQMDAAHGFMMRVQQSRLVDCGENLVHLGDAATDAGVEVLFSSTPFAKTRKRQFYLRSGLIQKYLGAAREMNRRGWVMKVEDAYRTPEMQKALQRTPAFFDLLLETVLWETENKTSTVEFVFRRLLAMVAFCPLAGTHISGSALDISVFDRATGEEIDRGAPYPTFNTKTPMASPYVEAPAQNNRQEITALMKRHGFIDYPWEFWHYSQQDAYHAVLTEKPSLARYGPVHWDSSVGQVVPVKNPTEPLNNLAEIEQSIEDSLHRLGVLTT